MNINKNVDSINSLKYVLSSCIPRSRPSTFLLSWPIFRATLVSIMSPPIGTPIFRATPDSTISPPIGTQLSIGPCDTSCASCRFHNPSSKSMRNAIHHLFTTLWWGKTTAIRQKGPIKIFTYIQQSNICLLQRLSCQQDWTFWSNRCQMLSHLHISGCRRYEFHHIVVQSFMLVWIENRLTDLKGEWHGHLSNVIHVISRSPMCEISGASKG
jgi:hypothetical protein